MVLMVTNDGAGGHRSLELQDLETTTTPCNFGGERRWLVCPGRIKELEDLGASNVLGEDGSCGKRVAKLYRVAGWPVSVTNLAGTGFQARASVQLKGGATVVNATNVNVVSDTQITCQLALPGTLGKYDVVVHNPDGGKERLRIVSA